MLEETGLPYTVHNIRLDEGEQKSPEFLAINPNGRIPAIVDGERNGPDRSGLDRNGLAVFESGAILLYLAEKTGKLLPADTEGRYAAIEWLMFQMAGVGPMQGQAHVFRHYAPEPVPYAEQRYMRETNRLYSVADGRLSTVPYLAGSRYTVADIALWPWVKVCEKAGVDLRRFPRLAEWFERVGSRPAVKRGSEIPPSPEETEEEKNHRVSKILV